MKKRRRATHRLDRILDPLPTAPLRRLEEHPRKDMILQSLSHSVVLHLALDTCLLQRRARTDSRALEELRSPEGSEREDHVPRCARNEPSLLRVLVLRKHDSDALFPVGGEDESFDGRASEDAEVWAGVDG